VHSLKDLPTEFPKGLKIGAVTEREDPHDILVTRSPLPVTSILRVGTSSLRRKSQLLAKWPRLQIVALRGNLDTRLGKLNDGKLDAIVVAAAGLNRLKIEIRRTPLNWMLPAPGQGAVAIEVRAGDRNVARLVAALNHPATERATTAERSLLTALGGGCLVPIGALAREKGKTLVLEGIVASEDGCRSVRAKLSGDKRYPARLGRQLAAILIKMGAKEILKRENK
jgi:hydroxymethylbilane synthase